MDMYSESTIDMNMDTASAKGDVEWLQENLQNAIDGLISYSSLALGGASLNAKIDVLEWWFTQGKAGGLRLLYGKMTLVYACMSGQIEVLEWWKSTDRKFMENNAEAIGYACTNHKFKILDWWSASGIEMDYNSKILTSVSASGNVELLRWLLKNGKNLIYTADAVDMASKNGRIEVLDIWLQAHQQDRVKILYSDKCILNAARMGNLTVLEWWRTSGLPLKISNDTIPLVILFNKNSVLEWMVEKNTSLFGTIQMDTIHSLFFLSKIFVIEWLLRR